MVVRLAALLLLATCLLALHASADSGRLLRVDDLNALQQVSDPQISPDGAWVAYVVGSVDAAADANTSDLWMTRWNGSETVRLTRTEAAEHTPRWSPDGRRLAFLSAAGDAAGVDQLWLLDWRSGETQRVTALPHAVTDFDWAPDSRRLVLVSAVTPSGSPAATTPQPIVITRLLYKRDGYGYLGNTRARLHLLDLATRKVVQLTNGPHDEIMPAFSPNGEAVAFASKLGDDPDSHLNWDILVQEARPGATPKRVSVGERMECDPVWGWGSKPAWSPDGKQLSCVQSGPLSLSWFTLQQVAVFPRTAGQGQLPTAALDRNTTQPRFSPNGRRLFFLLEDDQSVQLASIALDGSGLERLTPSGQTVSAYDLGADGKIAVLTSRSDRPAEIAVLEGGALRRLTHANDAWLADIELSQAHAFSFESADAGEIHGLLMQPPGAPTSTAQPSILRLHGGPVGQWQHEFDFGWQLLAAHGYVVIGPNPRGSSGRGEAFQRAIFGAWGGVDVTDVLASVDQVVKQGVADSKRLGIGGWSAGAMLTNYTIASDQRFRAATSGAGVSNMLAGYGTDEWWHDWEAELGRPWETLEPWLRASYPFLHADRITTPTLFLGGSEDYNVPLIHSEQMYLALRRLGVPTQLVVYPGESHSIARPSFRRDVLNQYLAWYGRWLASDSARQ
jgi:dipeptidyl aminopeptidase/acylaminoacyl peptidase